MNFLSAPIKSRAIFAFLAAMVLTLAGCGKNEDNQDANLRVLNLTVESGNLSIRVEDENDQWQTGIAPLTTTSFKNIDSGSQRLRISNSGGVIIDQDYNLLAEQKQLLLVYGGASSLGSALLNNDISSSESGKTKLRIFTAAVGLGTFDLYMTKADENYRSVEPKARNISGTTYEIDAGNYFVILTTPNTKDVIFQTTATRNFEDRKYYNLILFNAGSAELPSAYWLRQEDDAAPEFLTNPVSRIRAANTQVTIPSTNVTVDGTRVFTTITTGGVSSYAKIQSGTRTVGFTDGSSTQSVASVTQDFTGGRDYSTFLAANPAGGTPTAFSLLDKTLPPSSGKLRVRLVNASTLADLSLSLAFAAVTPTVPSRAASDYFEVTGGDGTSVTITQGAAATPVFSLAGTDLSAGRTYTFVVGGTSGALNLAVRQDN